MNIHTIKQLNETSLSCLDIVVSHACNGEDYRNLYIQNDDGDDLYIGELKDIRLVKLVWAVPAVVRILKFLQNNPTGAEDIDCLAAELLGELE